MKEKGMISRSTNDSIDNPREVEVLIKFDLDTEECEILSGFEDERLAFQDPIDYTAKLLQMAWEKWVREKIGIICPVCEREAEDDWNFCPDCGYTWNLENKDES
jgi:hypothetical protein